MKNLLYFFVVILFVSCNDANDPGVVNPDPELTMTVSPDTVTSGGFVTINVTTKFAVATTNNVGITKTSISWKDSVKITETTKIVVSAYNADGMSVKQEKTIIAIPKVIVVVPTRTDTLCSKPWQLKTKEAFGKDNNLLWSVDLTLDQKSDKYYFYKNENTKVFHQNGVQFGDCSWKWIGSNQIMIGDEITVYSLTDTSLVIYKPNGDGTEILKVTYWRE